MHHDRSSARGMVMKDMYALHRGSHGRSAGMRRISNDVVATREPAIFSLPSASRKSRASSSLELWTHAAARVIE